MRPRPRSRAASAGRPARSALTRSEHAGSWPDRPPVRRWLIGPLISAETAAAGLALYGAHRGNRPVTAVLYTHSPVVIVTP